MLQETGVREKGENEWDGSEMREGNGIGGREVRRGLASRFMQYYIPRTACGCNVIN